MRVTCLARSLLLLSTTYPSLTRACGVLVHNEVLRRAQYLYSLPSSSTVAAEEAARSLFSKYLNAPESAPVAQAGAFFPDWGYSCLWADDDSEAAHWPPFQKAWADYVIEKYGLQGGEPQRVLDEDEEAHLRTLIAFGFALSSHQSADEAWHSLRIASGFLKLVAMNDFNYNTAEAHKTIDIGGDVIFAARFTVPNGASWLAASWSFPIADIIAVYSRMGRSVSAAKLRSCAVRGLAAVRTELSLGPKWYDSYAERSPTLVTEIDGYYLGGVEEMASTAVNCWASLTKWYVHGTPEGEGAEWALCDIFKARWGWGRRDTSQHKHSGVWDTEEALHERVEFRSRDRFGVETFKYRDAVHSNPLAYRQTVPSSGPGTPSFADPTYISTYVPYSQFGHALAVGAIGPVPGDPAPHIAITAPLETEDSLHPNAGGVYILPLSQLSGTTPQSQLAIPQPLTPRHAPSTQPTSNVRFGQAATTWRPTPAFTTRSLLVISAPGPQIVDPNLPPDGHPAGRLDVFDGATKIQSWYGLGAPLGGRGVKWWGEVLASGALIGSEGEELVIGSPMSDGAEQPPPGECPRGFFYAQRGFVQVATHGDIPGVSTTTTPPRVYITSHTLPPAKQQQQQQPTIYTIPPPPLPPSQDPCALLPPARFGAALAITPHSRTLLIGAPGANAVYAYRYDNATAEFRVVYTITIPLEGKGKRVDFGGRIVVGSSPTGGGEWAVISAAGEEGGSGVVRVYTLLGGGARLMAEVVDEVGERFARFGRVLSLGVGRGEGGVFVGSGYAAGERGAVWWVDVGGILAALRRRDNQVVLTAEAGAGAAGEEEVRQVKAKRILLGPEAQKAQFGEALWSGDVDGDGVGDLVVGLPFAGGGGGEGGEGGKRLAGAVAVYLGVGGGGGGWGVGGV